MSDDHVRADVARLIDSLLPEDATLVRAIFAAVDLTVCARLIRDYYRDRDRADRMPRELMFVHIGMLSAIIDALAQRLEGKPWWN